MRLPLTGCFAALTFLTLSAVGSGAQEKAPLVQEGDFVTKDFTFRSGQSLAELKLHYRTLGKPVRDAQGRVTNAVLILHGTGGSGAQFLAPQFAGELFGSGQPLDTAKYFVILPDGIGHGKSSQAQRRNARTFPVLRLRRHGGRASCVARRWSQEWIICA